MTNFLVLYGSTDGHTAKVARSIGETLRTQGAKVDVVDAGTASPWPEDYGAVIVAASPHAGGYQRSVRSWVRAHAPVLAERPTAFVSVCIGALPQKPQWRRALRAAVDRFATSTGWKPTETKIVAGALLYTRYGWIKRELMKRLVRKRGGDTDTRRDYEYTDWNDMRMFAERFGRRVCGEATSRAAAFDSGRVRGAA